MSTSCHAYEKFAFHHSHLHVLVSRMPTENKIAFHHLCLQKHRISLKKNTESPKKNRFL